MMQNATIEIPEQMLAEMYAHLFPAGVRVEQGGFLLCTTSASDSVHGLLASEWLPLQRDDYIVQAADYLELNDEARVRVIKTAHERDAVLVEVHCHPGSYPACFSSADIVGLAEFVPHVRWRLKGKPYAALVFAQRSVDGLGWFGTSKIATPIECIVVGTKRLATTCLTGRLHGEISHA